MNVSDHWGQLREALVAVVEKAAKCVRLDSVHLGELIRRPGTTAMASTSLS